MFNIKGLIAGKDIYSNYIGLGDVVEILCDKYVGKGILFYCEKYMSMGIAVSLQHRKAIVKLLSDEDLKLGIVIRQNSLNEEEKKFYTELYTVAVNGVVQID